MPVIKLIEPIIFSKSSWNPIFGQIFGLQRAGNEARNTKMCRGQETHPIRVNARYEMNWANSFSKSSGNLVYRETDRRTDRHRVESSIPFGGAGVSTPMVSLYRRGVSQREWWVDQIAGWSHGNVAIKHFPETHLTSNSRKNLVFP